MPCRCVVLCGACYQRLVCALLIDSCPAWCRVPSCLPSPDSSAANTGQTKRIFISFYIVYLTYKDYKTVGVMHWGRIPGSCFRALLSTFNTISTLIYSSHDEDKKRPQNGIIPWIILTLPLNGLSPSQFQKTPWVAAGRWHHKYWTFFHQVKCMSQLP